MLARTFEQFYLPFVAYLMKKWYITLMNIPYAKHEITKEDIDAVVYALKSGYLTGGEQVQEFENIFKHTFNTEYALAVSSGTAGLHLAVSAMDVPAGKTILVPSLTFAATANSVLYCGAKVEFVDIDPETFLLDIDSMEEKIKFRPEKYAGVIAVDYAGYPVDIEKLSALCKTYHLWLIEDAAHALGAVSNRHEKSIQVGSSLYADITVFSFHPAKHLTTGEGGMITTRNANIYDKIKLLRSHAMSKANHQSQEEGWYYSIEHLGYNYRMSEINAALGVSQLKRADNNLQRRREIAKRYDRSLREIQVKTPIADDVNVHAYHLYIIQSKDRHALYDKLKARGIYTQVHYVPLHLQAFYKNFGGAHNLPNTEAYYHSCLSIPMYPSLTETEQEYVVQMLQECSQ